MHGPDGHVIAFVEVYAPVEEPFRGVLIYGWSSVLFPNQHAGLYISLQKSGFAQHVF